MKTYIYCFTLFFCASFAVAKQVKLTIMIEDPRDIERKRTLGIEDPDEITRDDLADALVEVNHVLQQRGESLESNILLWLANAVASLLVVSSINLSSSCNSLSFFLEHSTQCSSKIGT
jgi:hypothetical protein